MFNRLGTDFTARLKIFPPCCREWRLWSGNALALHTLPPSPGTLCGGIWQACGWSPAWSCISSSFPNARLSCACPLPVTHGLSPASTEVRRWPWPCTSTSTVETSSLSCSCCFCAIHNESNPKTREKLSCTCFGALAFPSPTRWNELK